MSFLGDPKNSTPRGTLLLAVSLPTFAAADPSRFEPVVVTATRREQSLLDVPYSVEVLGGDDLRRRQMPANLPEALLQTPGVLVQQTARGQGSPYLRGFTGFRTVALVDGIRLNNSTFRDGPNQYWATVDALAFDRLEIVRGPGSVLHGSDAVGGVVNALMHAPAPGPNGAWGGDALYRAGMADRAHLGRIGFQTLREGSWGLAGGFSRKSYGDLQGGEMVGRQRGTGYDQWDMDLRLVRWLAERTRLTVAYQRTEQDDVMRTHRTVDGLRWAGLSRGSERLHAFDQYRQLAYARLEHTTGRGDEVTATLSWQGQYERQLVERANRTRQRSTVDVDTAGFSVQAVSPGDWCTWTYGVEHYHDFVDSSQLADGPAGPLSVASIQGPVAADSQYGLLGVFAQDELPLGRQVSLTLGGRFTLARAEAGRLRDPVLGTARSYADDWTDAVGSGRLLWHPGERRDWSLFAGASQGFRAPNLSDLTRLDIARSGEFETAALDLRPERFVSFEAGVRARRDGWGGELLAYHTVIEDLIVRTPTGGLVGGAAEVTKRNAGEGWVHGVEASGRVGLGGGFGLTALGAWQDGEADAFPTSAPAAVRAPLSRVHPLSGQAGLRWDAPRGGWFLEVFGRAAARQDRLSPDDRRDTQRIPPGGTPGWATLNFRAGWEWRRTLFVNAALENALDVDYRLHGSGFNQPGRDVRLQLEGRF